MWPCTERKKSRGGKKKRNQIKSHIRLNEGIEWLNDRNRRSVCVLLFCQPIVSMHFCFFFHQPSLTVPMLIRATFETSGRAKHQTFAARIGASADCCNTYKNTIINTSFLIMFRGNVAEMVLLLCVSPGK